MAEEIEYKGYKITSQSYQDDESGKWVPSVLIVPMDEAQNSEMPMSWEREFDEQAEADDFALEGAQFYVDSYY
ncbi:MAG: hypothetical protein WDZ40_01160 [Candidatus Spechtbacterales bacterium]